MGLLDALSSDDAKLGLGLLAAGGPSTVPMNIGQRVQMAMQGVDADKQNKLKLQLLQSQVDENKSQDQLRQAQLQQQAKRDAFFMGDGGMAPQQKAPGAAPGGGGMSGGGEALKQATGVPANTPPPAQGKFAEWSQKFGIPVESLVADYFTNGGKGIADMMFKRGTTDMQVSNGFAYDKNKLGTGFMPQVNTSADGKTSMIMPNGSGGVSVQAPQGALDTFAGYQGAQAAFKPIKVFDPAQQREVYTNEAAVAGGPSGGRAAAPGYGSESGLRATAQGDMGSTRADILREIATTKQQMAQAPNLDPQTRALLQGHIDQMGVQLEKYHGGAAPAQGGGYAAGPSAAESAANAAAQTRAVGTASADVVRDTATQKKEKSAGEMIAATRRARELLQQGPTGSGVGEMVDKGASFFGTSTKGAETAAKLDIVAGDLVNNVPRMEGPQSDGDRLEYKLQAGRAADRTLPPKIRLAAMDEVERLQSKYAKLNGGDAPAADKKDDAPKGKIVDSLPTANASNKGQRIRDTATGKILVSNGIQWKEQ